MTRDKDTKYYVDASSGNLVVENEKLLHGWDVWEHTVPVDDGKASELQDSDERVVSCARAGSGSPLAEMSSKEPFGCERLVRGPEFAMEYAFRSNTRIPVREIEDLDPVLFDRINSWRCER